MDERFKLHRIGARALREDGIDASLPLWRESFAGLDWLSLKLSDVYRGRGIRGDGAGVVLIPGMLASDLTMHEVERWLRRVGYRPYLSGIGRNDRCPELSLAAVVRAVDRAFDETGRKVHVVGHSLGGLLARGVAIVRPRQVAQVVTLGSPVHGARVHPFVRMAAHRLAGDCDGECVAALQQPLPSGVAELNVYSRADGIVDWRTCVRPDADSIEVTGTHCGMVVNADVYRALARALARAHAPLSRSRVLAPLPAKRHVTAVSRVAA